MTRRVVIDHDRYRRLLSEIPRVSHPLYGQLRAPQHPDQAIMLLRALVVLRIGAWRGHGRACWKIDSALARRYASDRALFRSVAPLNEGNLRAVERTVIERARAAGHAPDLGELELLARLQHHGAATRLLDCTRS